MDASDLPNLDATAQADLVRSGETSPEELVEASIRNIEELNPKLNAVIHELFEEGLEAARGDIPDGPFKGVPFLLKDLGAAFAGQPYHLGMKLLKEADFRAPVDTYLAQRFRDAGFITIGKTNLPELGILPTTEPDAYGPSRNPWNTEHSTGGSSGGSGAAVASGMVPIAHANDGGGSIRIPASMNGLVGLKPTRQRISQGPILGDVMSGLTIELVVSRSVRDTAAVLEAVHGSAPGDPYVADPPIRPYTQELEEEPKNLRIGIWTESLIDDDPDPEVVAATRDAAKELEALGHSVEELDISAFSAMPLVDTFKVRWAAGQASTLKQLGMVVGRPVTKDDVEPLTWALAEKGNSDSAGDYLSAIGLHQMMSRMMAGFHEGGFDLVLSPTLGEPPPPLGTFDDSGPDPFAAFHRAFLTAAFTAPINATGQPAISLPLHWTDDGLPVGVQFIAPTGREDILISLAAQLERAKPWADRRPPVFAGAAETAAPS